MAKSEAEFLAELTAAFKIEAAEHLAIITDGLLLLEKEPDSPEKEETINSIFRAAHSLKGNARTVNQYIIQDICQALEDVLAELRSKNVELSKNLFDTIYETVNLIGKLIDYPGNIAEFKEKVELEALIPRLEELLSKKAERQEEPKPQPIVATPPAKEPEKQSIAEASKKEEAEPKKGQPPAKSPKGAPTIRVSSQKLDTLLQQVEEMLSIKLSSGQHGNSLATIKEYLGTWEKEWATTNAELQNCLKQREGKEKQIYYDLIKLQEDSFKHVKEEIGKLIRASNQEYHVVGGMVDNLLGQTKKLLMQPFSTLLETFPRMVREIANTLHKEAIVEVQGGDIEVDRRILEELKDPLMHLIRNSIDHGIEPKEEREKNGKPAVAIITVMASKVSGNTVEILIADDGCGMNLEKIKESAIKHGAISSKELELMTAEEVLKLSFLPGISTSPIITDISGRGVGLGVVSEKVEKLGGQIFIDTAPGLGTTFKIVLPSTLATFRGIHIQAGDQDFIIPTHNVKRVIRFQSSEIKKIENKETITIDGKAYSYVHLADVLELTVSSDQKEQGSWSSLLLIRSAEMTVAFGVDKVINEQEVFVKDLGKQLVKVRNIAAATIMEWGKVIPILDPFDLIKSAISVSASAPRIIAQTEDIKTQKTILIAEDSVTARILLKNILESSGFTVLSAVDGAEAFALLKTEKVDLLLSDVEMPRMDGFLLTEKVRSTEKLKDLPIVLCTSRGSREDRERGIEAGANAYIDKSSFAQNNLLEIINNLL